MEIGSQFNCCNDNNSFGIVESNDFALNNN